jgi:GNAT superfamily N-acetyltransferase
MSAYTISVEMAVTPEDRRVISNGLTEHALPITRTPGFEPLAVFARDPDRAILAGVIGTVNWNWLHVNLVWVSESLRHTGLGRRLMAEIERVAVERGCTHAHLDTFSYQARPFYERLGYRVFGTLDDYPPGQKRFFMEKRLGR